MLSSLGGDLFDSLVAQNPANRKVCCDLQVILMDHMDWMDDAYARELSAMLYQQMTPGGRVIWRSAALEPPYAPIIAAAGFEV